MITVSVRKQIIEKASPFYYDWSLVKEYKRWCSLYVGADRWNYYGYYQRTPGVFRFKDPADALAFRLRFDLV